MSDYEGMYFKLFNMVSDALSALRCGQNGEAEDILVRAQQDCEEIFIDSP